MPNKKNIQAPSLPTEPSQRFRPYTVPGSTGKTSENGKTAETVTVCSPTDLMRKKFENQNGEWEFVASDGKVFKFHQWVLEEQIEYFRALFSHQDTVECENKRIVVPPEVNLPGPALEAFLRYVYYKDTAGMATSFSVTCALVRAGHYYNIPKLIKLAAGKIERYAFGPNSAEWFNVKELWELYQHVWLWEEARSSRRRLMKRIRNAFKMCTLTSTKVGRLRDELLELTNGNPALGDLLFAFARSSQRERYSDFSDSD